MKILLIGSKYRVITFANQLVAKNIDVHVISNRKMKNGELGNVDPRIFFHEDLLDKLKKDAKNKYSLLKIPFNLFTLKRLIKKIKPDIIHAFFIQGHGWYTALTGFHPFVLTTMGSDINANQGAYGTLVKKAMLSYTIKRADLVTVQSRQGLEEVKKIDPEKDPVYFRAGYNPNLFFPDHKPKHLIDKFSLKNKFIIISPRGFHKEFYNTETIVKGFSDFNKQVKNSFLFLLGNDNNTYGEKIKKLVEKLGIKSNTKFLGYINHDELRDYFNLSDVGVSLTLKDGFPASLTELMACGKPIISGKNKSINELIDNNKNGFIITPLDTNELVHKLVKLYQDKSLRKRIENKIIEDIEQHSATKYCDLMINQYDLLKN